MFLTGEEHTALHKTVVGALVSYQWLARAANDAGWLTWSVVNKHHVWKHVSDQAQYLNPRMVWCYMAKEQSPATPAEVTSVTKSRPELCIYTYIYIYIYILYAMSYICHIS